MAIIDKPTEYFDTRTYSASGSGSVSDVGFQPDFLWFKNRTIVGDHGLMDAIRGVNKILHSNDNNAEVTSGASNDFTAFTSNGFTYGTSAQLDTSSGTPCTWLWKANGAGSSNTDGSITSTVSANTTSGFSIVSYTGTGSNATIGHGLGSAPQVVLLKERNGTNNWLMSHQPLSASLGDYTRFMTLNSTGAVSGAGNVVFQGSAFTSSVFNVGTSVGSNGSSQTYIAYCFAEKQGYSKFGLYTGNGNADGTFVYTGFKPAFVMCKITSGTDNWILMDNKRLGYNASNYQLIPNSTLADQTPERIDLLSNGFKTRSTNGEVNGSGSSYIFMAFAENPFVTSTTTGSIPATAR